MSRNESLGPTVKEYKNEETDADSCDVSTVYLQSGRWTYLTKPHLELGLGICEESY